MTTNSDVGDALLLAASQADVLIVLASDAQPWFRDEGKEAWQAFQANWRAISSADCLAWTDTKVYRRAAAVDAAVDAIRPDARGWVTAWPEICAVLRRFSTIPLDEMLAEVRERRSILAAPDAASRLPPAAPPPPERKRRGGRPPLDKSNRGLFALYQYILSKKKTGAGEASLLPLLKRDAEANVLAREANTTITLALIETALSWGRRRKNTDTEKT